MISNINSVFSLERNENCQVTSFNQFITNEDTKCPFWAHVSLENSKAVKWLREKSPIDPLFIDAMLSRKVRPRFLQQDDAFLIILRVADVFEVSDYEELRSLRIYMDSKRIISISLYPLPVIHDYFNAFIHDKKRCHTLSQLFLDLITDAVRGIEVILEDLEERADILEKRVLDDSEDPEETEVAQLALDGLSVRRYLAPQIEVFSQLYFSESPLVVSSKRRIKEIHERVSRQMDEVTVFRDRTRIISDQLHVRAAQEVNDRLYVFSAIAVIFVPLSFLTGLLGVNLGGIPGADNPLGFLIFCLGLVSISAVLVFFFKRLKWL